MAALRKVFNGKNIKTQIIFIIQTYGVRKSIEGRNEIFSKVADAVYFSIIQVYTACHLGHLYTLLTQCKNIRIFNLHKRIKSIKNVKYVFFLIM